MAAALWDLQEAILGWYRHPDDRKPLNADTLLEAFKDILDEHSINLDKLWR